MSKSARAVLRCVIFVAGFTIALGVTDTLRLAAAPVATEQVPVNDAAILNHLNAAINWYRQLTGIDVSAGQPSDILYVQNAHDSATQALQLAFQSAEAEAALNAKPAGKKTNQRNAEPAPPEATGSAAPSNTAPAAAGSAASTTGSAPGTPTEQGLTQAASNAAARTAQVQAQVDAMQDQIAKASGRKRQELSQQLGALQGELELDKAQLEALQKLANFIGSQENVTTGLLGKINELKQSVPEIAANPNAPKPTATGGTSKATRADNSGLFGQLSVLFSQMGDIHSLDQLIANTTRLRNTAEQLQLPLRSQLKSLVQQGRDAATQPLSTDPAQQEATRHTLETLTAQFKAVSASAVPLRQEIILLDQVHASLQEWRTSVLTEYGHVLRSLLMRVAAILIALLFVVVLSAVWKRATYRYVHDVRRRRQLLLVRRFITVFLVCVVIALGFISEFSSLATFAGFITAGLAVALQTVILSLAAYFFLIGRYGVRVGDRITVAGVTGDVIDIGLVRLYMMELAGTGIDLYSTGRLVVFANSVLFQAAPLFKQLPGTAYAWHELAVTLSTDADLALAERELLEAVNSVYAEYRPDFERQHGAVERLLDVSFSLPVPKAQLHFTDAGLEFMVRYPVELHRADEVDDKMTRKLMEVIISQPQLKAAVTGTPRLRSAIKA